MKIEPEKPKLIDPANQLKLRPTVPMSFRVGPWIYRVIITADDLEDDDGGPAVSLYSWRDRSIFISEALGPEQRKDALIHELDHAWVAHFGLPKDFEGLANRNSSFQCDVFSQFVAQGGIANLAEMRRENYAVQSVADTPQMKFHVGGCSYRIELADDSLKDNSGLPAAGLFDWSAGIIYIRASLDALRRRDVLFHELGHAWELHFGFPAETETRMNYLASFAANINDQFLEQGGIQALARLSRD